MQCPSCGTPTTPGAAFCDNCGASLSGAGAAPLPPTTAIGGGGTCPNCNQPIIPGEAFCDGCGASLDVQQQQAAIPAPSPAAPPPPPTPPVAAAPAQTPAAGQTCTGCGHVVTPGATFCDNCGTPVSGVVAPPPVVEPAAQIPQAQPPVQPPPVAGQTCAGCGYPVTPGAAFCDNCGATVSANPVVSTNSVPVVPPTGSMPRLAVQSTGASLPFPAGKPEIWVGREDPVSNIFPEIDLDPHGGDEGGVSRQHAKFTQQGNQWHLTDWDSVNFTFVNNQKLQPKQPQAVNSGDQIRFGKVITTFHIG